MQPSQPGSCLQATCMLDFFQTCMSDCCHMCLCEPFKGQQHSRCLAGWLLLFQSLLVSKRAVHPGLPAGATELKAACPPPQQAGRAPQSHAANTEEVPGDVSDAQVEQLLRQMGLEGAQAHAAVADPHGAQVTVWNALHSCDSVHELHCCGGQQGRFEPPIGLPSAATTMVQCLLLQCVLKLLLLSAFLYRSLMGSWLLCCRVGRLHLLQALQPRMQRRRQGEGQARLSG